MNGLHLEDGRGSTCTTVSGPVSESKPRAVLIISSESIVNRPWLSCSCVIGGIGDVEGGCFRFICSMMRGSLASPRPLEVIPRRAFEYLLRPRSSSHFRTLIRSFASFDISGDLCVAKATTSRSYSSTRVRQSSLAQRSRHVHTTSCYLCLF